MEDAHRGHETGQGQEAAVKESPEASHAGEKTGHRSVTETQRRAVLTELISNRFYNDK